MATEGHGDAAHATWQLDNDKNAENNDNDHGDEIHDDNNDTDNAAGEDTDNDNVIAVEGDTAATPAIGSTGNMAEDALHKDDAGSHVSSPPIASRSGSGANAAPATQASAYRSHFLLHVANYPFVLVTEK
jgi:hypothetical protein